MTSKFTNMNINRFEQSECKIETTPLLVDSRAAANSTFAIGGVPYSADTFVQAKSFVLRFNISGKNPAHRKSANRYV